MGQVNKTVATDVDVAAYIAALEPERRREETSALVALYERITGEPAKMWGPSMIGFGEYHYTYDSGRSGTSMRSGFAPRKGKHSIYLMCDTGDEAAAQNQEALLGRLGKHKMEKSCLCINRLDQVDMDVLEEIIANNVAEMNRLYPPA
ncbi:uncharacterized protein DUF1801 [Blastomonas natatoria]|uniref:Uncharacterized protein DUF1801 n=1 Tax=Blastomonas natatoria TaxID=34015 RepID=A0A2V3V2N4_9SPHN|nr:DUF1801 domain-containing protein [Blastomonas natatoria]PXW74495.1 uncharacterized protein DUF1801 [Blastomonas natatoria]